MDDLLNTLKYLDSLLNKPSHQWKSQVVHTILKGLYQCLLTNETDCSNIKYHPSDELHTHAKEIITLLRYGIISNKISSDNLLVAASCLVLLISYVADRPPYYFAKLLRSCNQNYDLFGIYNSKLREPKIPDSDQPNLFSSMDIGIKEVTLPYEVVTSQIDNLIGDSTGSNLESVTFLPGSDEVRSENLENYIFDCMQVEPSSHMITVLLGLVNTKPSWLYSMISVTETPSDCTNGNLLFLLWPLLNKLCLTSSSQTSQSFQVLYLWMKVAKDIILENCKCLDNGVVCDAHLETKNVTIVNDWSGNRVTEKDEKDEPSFPCPLCCCSSFSELFSLHPQGKILTLLHLSLENEGKGAFLKKCMRELIDLHEDFQAGHAAYSLRVIIKSAIQSGAWHSKGTYLQLQIALNYLSAEEILMNYPDIPKYMGSCLRSNNLSAVVTALYRLIISQIDSLHWILYFSPEHQKLVANSDDVLRHTYISFWLPATVTQYPELFLDLVTLCGDSLEGWQGKIAIIRVAKLNSMALFDGKNTRTTVDDNKYLEIKSIISNGTIHGDDMIRGDTFKFLCINKKTTSLLSKLEIDFIMTFLEENLNVDSLCFRQTVIRSFVLLIQRVRSAACHTIKNEVSNANVKIYNDDKLLVLFSTMKGYVELNQLIDFIVWLVCILNDNLNLFANYARIATTLNLYWHLLCEFYDPVTGQLTEGYKLLVKYIEFVISNHSELEIANFTTSSTLENILALCTYEVNDIRELAAKTFLLLQKIGVHLPPKGYYNWLKEAINLCDSPKSNVAESGATLVEILVATVEIDEALTSEWKIVIESLHCHHSLALPETALEGCLTNPYNSWQSVIHFLIKKLEKQFLDAKDNVLNSSYSSPIYGTIMAVTFCLRGIKDTDEHTNVYVTQTIMYLVDVYEQIVKFVLESLAACSYSGSKVSPSFAEMGMAIEEIIRDCRSKRKPNSMSPINKFVLSESTTNPSSSLFAASDENLDCLDTVFNGEVISVDHQVVLSFFWQLLKVCCWSCSKLTERWHHLISLGTWESIVTNIIVHILTGTRHKGAMEAAQLALHEVCSTIYSKMHKSTQHIIEKQLLEILDTLELHCEASSVTRRSAGLSMIFTASCSAVPKNSDGIIKTVLKRLLTLSTIKVKDVLEMDVTPALCLHILRSMVLSSSLTSSVLPEICVTCLQGFSSESWSVRNAALQLFGAIVPKLVGQKRAKDDAASINRVTFTEFCNRNTKVVSILLQKLEECKQFSGNRYSIDCSLVPILSLLSRLNAGAEVLQSKCIKGILCDLREKMHYFVGYPVLTIRRLAASALCLLATTSDVWKFINTIAEICLKNVWRDSNLVNGYLLTIRNVFLISSVDINAHEGPLCQLILVILGEKYPNFVNKCLAFDIAENIEHLELDLSPPKDLPGFPKSEYLPGFHNFVKKVNIWKLHKERFSNTAIFSLMNQQTCFEEAINLFGLNVDKFEAQLSEMQVQSWKYICITEDRLQLNGLFYLLRILLEKVELDATAAVPCIPHLQNLLQSCSKSSSLAHNCFIVSSYFIKYLKWFESKSEDDIERLVLIWTETAEEFAISMEDERLTLAKALNIALPFIMKNSKIFSNIRISVIKIALELMQDEERNVRAEMCLIALGIKSSWSEVRKTEVIENIGCGEHTGDSVLEGFPLQPAVALKVFVSHLLSEALMGENIDMFKFLYSHFQSEVCEQRTVVQLFESHSPNIFKECHIICHLIVSLLVVSKSRTSYSFSENFIQSVRKFCKREVETLTRRLKDLNHLREVDPVTFLTNRKYCENLKISTLGCDFLTLVSNLPN